MRRMIADLYKLLYKLTHSKLIALPFAVIYISLLNTITIYGLSLLLAEEVPFLESISDLFRPPISYIVFILITGFNFWLMLPLQNLSKEKSKPPAIGPVTIYTIACICILLYVKYGDKLF